MEQATPGIPSEALHRAKRRNLAIHLGVSLILVGLVASASLVNRTILPPDSIEPGSRRAAVLGICRILMILFGLGLLIRRPRVTTVHLCALFLAGAFSAVLGAITLQVAYVPPRIVSGWRSFAPAAEQNQLGFRGRKIEYSSNDFVIVLLGDSHVESMALTFDTMPERRLESHLDSLGKKAKVFSLGAGGYGQDQQLLVLQEYYQKHRADLVVLWQTPGNDVWNNLFCTHMINRNPKPTFWLENGSLHGPSEAMGQRLADSPIVIVSLWQRVFGLPWRDKAWEGRLPEAYTPLDRAGGPVNLEWQQRWDTDQGRMRAENLASDKNHFAIMLSPLSPRVEYGLKLTRALTQRIEQIVVSHGGKLVLFDVDVAFFKTEGDQIYGLNGKYYRVSKRQYETNWAYVRRGFEMELVPVTVEDWRVAPDDGHYNVRATDQIMRDLAQRLAARIPNRAL